jgi:alkylhydroperoxidase family enzyme
MRLDTPRLEPLAADQIDPEIRNLFGEGPILNIFRTLAHHPKLMKRWLVFGSHVLAKSTLAPRARELVILRVGWLCRAGYEWGQHVLIARGAGVSEDEIERVTHGPDAPGWDELDAVILRATDELHNDAFIGDETWSALSTHLETEQVLDLIFTVGQYRLVSMALNTLGVQPDAHLDLPTLPER